MNNPKQRSWPDRFEERLHIFALGESIDVDAFLVQSALRPDFVWWRMGNGPTNGLELLLSGGQAIPLREQEEIAIAYLMANRDELRVLAKFPGVEALNLGLAFRLPLNAIGCAPGPPAKLMFHALDAGVTPLYYVTLEGRQVPRSPCIRRLPKSSSYDLERWRGTPLWRAIEKALADEVRSGSLIEENHHEFIVESICDAVKRRKKAIVAQLDQ
jgi:hypothetical protein